MIESPELILRTLAVATTLALALILLAVGRSRPAARPAAMLALAVTAFVITSAQGAAGFLGLWIWPLTALCVTKSVWFWLLARSLFSEPLPKRVVLWPVVAIVALAGTWQQLIFLDRFRAGVSTPIESAASVALDAALAIFVMLALHTAWKGMNVDLVEGRRQLRVWFLTATGVYLAAALGIQSYNLFLGQAMPPLIMQGNIALISAVALAGIAALVQLRPGRWLEPARKPQAPLNRIENVILGRLKSAVEADPSFLSDLSTISQLAERLGTREHTLRRAINGGMGYRNFNDFLHDWRIRAACRELVEPGKTQTAVMTIAMNVGYGSIGTFNRAFKARTGMTPTRFRQRHLSA